MTKNPKKNARTYYIKNNSAFYDPEKYDFASAIFDKNIVGTFTKSGMHDVACIIQKELFKRDLLDSLFIELNLIGTLLEEKSPNVLNSLTFIREQPSKDGHLTSEFARNVQKYSNAIIKELYSQHGFTIFYHPDIFIEQERPKIPYSIIEPHRKSRVKELDLNDEPQDIKNSAYPYHDLGLCEMDSDAEPWVGGKAKIVVGNSQFKRDYEGIVETAESIRKKGTSVEEAMHQFHRYYHFYFARKRRTVYMAIPILGSYASNRREIGNLKSIQGQGVVFLFFTVPDSYPASRNIEKDINEVAECLFDRIGALMRLITYNYLFNLGVNLAENVKKKAIQSAVSAIMSRNMSHNLGSHCMHYTKTALDSLSGRLYGHGPEIRGAARLIAYIQGRMDFLATLVSGEEYPYGAVNFKSQILDILNVDDFSKRHYQASSIRDKYKVIKQSHIQHSLEALSTQLERIIEEKKERKNDELVRIVESTENLINQIEGLKLDNANMRTTNFLLENLIKSERFYREDIYDAPVVSSNEKPFYLHVRHNGILFTGSSQRMKEEENVKTKLSELNIAMPGGLMSTHAFFNIVENLIRNSAKHRAVDLTEKALITTIDIRDVTIDGEHKIQFTIYDNKHNASLVFPIIETQLKELKVLNDDTTINKKSKGMKEMLIAALWLKSNEFEERYSDLLNEIEIQKNGDKKIALIKKYGYEIVKVDNDGNDANDDENANLGLRINLPYFETYTVFPIKYNSQLTISQQLLSSLKEKPVRADIIELEKNANADVLAEAKQRFPRLYDSSIVIKKEDIDYISAQVVEKGRPTLQSYTDTLRLYSILLNRFGPNINQYQIVFGDSSSKITSPDKVIYFQRHFNKSQDFKDALNFLYADSVSGGNYTVTLQDNYIRGHSGDGKSLTWSDKYFSFKIIESALTRITLIDERLSNDYDEKELMSKNIRVLNLNPDASEPKSIWSGSSFKDNDDYTLFLSIHLGLIEKVIGNENNWFMRQYDKLYTNEEIDRPERASFFMSLLKEKFGKGREVFISVHSGRGNYSYELEHSLKEYPFINLSAIESVFTNSKFLLTQLFYNTIYIGKGVYNQ